MKYSYENKGSTPFRVAGKSHETRCEEDRTCDGEMARRIIGISTPIGGIQWAETGAAEREHVRHFKTDESFVFAEPESYCSCAVELSSLSGIALSRELKSLAIVIG
jgi:hypothetical protein